MFRACYKSKRYKTAVPVDCSGKSTANLKVGHFFYEILSVVREIALFGKNFIKFGRFLVFRFLKICCTFKLTEARELRRIRVGRGGGIV